MAECLEAHQEYARIAGGTVDEAGRREVQSEAARADIRWAESYYGG